MLNALYESARSFRHKASRNAIETAQQLQEKCGLKPAVSIPETPLCMGHYSVADNVCDAPMGAFAQANRQVCDALLTTLDKPKDAPLNIYVVAPRPRSGTSTLALSMARSFALMGKRAILGEEAQSSHQPQITPEAKAVYHPDPMTKALILTQPISRPPAEGLPALPPAAPGQQTICIYDAPPLLRLNRMYTVARHADIVVLCACRHRNLSEDIFEAMAILRNANAPNTPVLPIFNRCIETVTQYNRAPSGRWTSAPSPTA